MVTASIRGRDEAAGRLANAIGWFWTVYTTAALVGVALANRAVSAWTAGLLALPALLLVAAYALVIWALTPIGISFDPRVPTEIARAHANATVAKQRRLTAATACTLVAALAVAAAVATTATTRPEPAPALHATHTVRGSGKGAILVRGQFPVGQAVTIAVIPSTDAAQQDQSVEVLEVASADGTVRTTIPVPAAKSYEVTASWSDRGSRGALTRTVTGSPTARSSGISIPAVPTYE
jgi:hypothetical protein